ncbi:MAG TPA: TIGR02266 family protein, partial [Kofleriaceae bacterium]
MATSNTRTANRSPVTLKIKFKSETLNQFIERYSVDISHGGIFIRTKDPLPVGTALRFEFQLKDASPLITGDGTVVWTREFDPTRSGVAPGMGVRFDRLPSESQEILEQILAYKSAKLGGENTTSEVPAFLDVPTKVAQVGPGGQPLGNSTPFGEVPTRVTPAHVLKSLQQGDDPRRTLIGIGMSQVKSNGERDDSKTPLPRPLPFHADLDEFPDEAFEEATKVAELEALAKKSAEDRIEGYGASMDDDVTMQRNRRPTAPAPEAVAAAAAASAQPDPLAAASKFQAVAAFDRAMRSGMPDDDEEEGGFAHSDRMNMNMNMASAQAMPQQVPQEYRPQPAMVQPEDVERDGGSSLPWIIAAAIVLVVASIGGFLLLNGNNEKAAGEDEGKKDRPTVPLAAADGKQTAPATPAGDSPQAMPPV